MAGFEAGDENRQWQADFRGLGGRRRFIRVEKDADGRDVYIYEVDDDEWNPPPKGVDYGSK